MKPRTTPRKPYRPFRMRLIADHGTQPPAGSSITVERILKNHYVGVWGSMYGTYTVKVRKCDCRREGEPTIAGVPVSRLIAGLKL